MLCTFHYLTIIICKNGSTMRNFLNKLLQPKIEIPPPERYPNFNNIVEWMDSKVAYYEYKYPDSMDNLFNPSSGDYLPLGIIVGASEKQFKENIAYYRELKSKYPEAVAKAKSEFLTYSYYRGGAPEDYPD